MSIHESGCEPDQGCRNFSVLSMKGARHPRGQGMSHQRSFYADPAHCVLLRKKPRAMRGIHLVWRNGPACSKAPSQRYGATSPGPGDVAPICWRIQFFCDILQYHCFYKVCCNPQLFCYVIVDDATPKILQIIMFSYVFCISSWNWCKSISFVTFGIEFSRKQEKPFVLLCVVQYLHEIIEKPLHLLWFVSLGHQGTEKNPGQARHPRGGGMSHPTSFFFIILNDPIPKTWKTIMFSDVFCISSRNAWKSISFITSCVPFSRKH